MFAVVVPNLPPVDGVYHYRIPEALQAQVRPGTLVAVPFANRPVQGVVMRLDDHAPVPDPYPITAVLDAEPVLNAAQRALLERMAAATLAPMGALLPLFLPPGLAQHADTLYALSGRPLPADLSPAQARLVALLRQRGPLRGRQIDRKIPREIWQPAARTLARRGLLHKRPVLAPPRVRPKTIRTAQLAVTPAQAQAAMDTLGKSPSTQQRRRRALEFLLQEPAPVAVSWVYAASGCNLNDLHFLARRDLVILRETEIWRDPLDHLPSPGKADEIPLQLSPAQERALQALLALWQAAEGQRKPALLEGVTASGKTEVYLRLVQHLLQEGRTALVLVPEIALTAQLVRRFMHRFPGQVGLVHSRLSPGERYDTWRRARAGLLKIIIGPRSALFMPLPNLGLIVLDECHDAAYHQNTPPFYDARQAAADYAALAGGLLVMGSATPTVAQRFAAERGRYLHLQLPHRVTGRADLPPVRLVDMRQELQQGNKSPFSLPLQEALAETLLAGQQAILYLNRRGTASYVFCRDCGHVVRCPRCEVPLAWHSAEARLRCHHCNYQRQMPRRCPACRSQHIRQYGLGAEAVEAALQKLFPSARTLRLDRDAVRQNNAAHLLHYFRNRQADVLIGTQMLAKGFDFPHVALVGVILAEVGLYFPDPFAGERVFQLLTQVAGRAGRSAAGGQVIFQTYHPEHYVLQAAAAHDVNRFYQQELAYRRQMGYPPFSRLLRLEFRHREAETAEHRAAALADQLRAWMRAENRRELALIGPAPAFFSRRDGKYRWQIILRGPNPAAFMRGRLPADWLAEVDPTSLL